MWRVSSRSGVATLPTAIHLLLVTTTEVVIEMGAAPDDDASRERGGACGRSPS